VDSSGRWRYESRCRLPPELDARILDAAGRRRARGGGDPRRRRSADGGRDGAVFFALPAGAGARRAIVNTDGRRDVLSTPTDSPALVEAG
jgi:hypothetical protein